MPNQISILALGPNDNDNDYDKFLHVANAWAMAGGPLDFLTLLKCCFKNSLLMVKRRPLSVPFCFSLLKDLFCQPGSVRVEFQALGLKQNKSNLGLGWKATAIERCRREDDDGCEPLCGLPRLPKWPVCLLPALSSIFCHVHPQQQHHHHKHNKII